MIQNTQKYLEAIEAELRDILKNEKEPYTPLYGMMRYHMGWLNNNFRPREAPSGKRLRPILCLLACEAVGGRWEAALPAAVAIELVHNFSLIHDDIEDHSDMRRHRTAVWRLWGIAQGINTGDALWAISRLAFHRLLNRGYGPDRVLRVIRCLDDACLQMCKGQYLDIHFETVDAVSLSEYKRMIEGKTTALISASLAMGAVLGEAEESAIASYRAFGQELGMTFQIIDDLLGIWGDSQTTGKSTASDILEKKKTLPILYALQWEKERGHDELIQLYKRKQLSQKDIPAVLELLERANARAYVREQALKHHRQALEHLEATEIENPAHETLRAIAIDLIDRSF
ncbi:MAG: polyprenyl synthetase family protein [Chloroflexota bacterium]|nr:polyprenyl synthetase family protein [Chloroflexota bacterium]